MVNLVHVIIRATHRISSRVRIITNMIMRMMARTSIRMCRRDHTRHRMCIRRRILLHRSRRKHRRIRVRSRSRNRIRTY